MPEAGTHQGPDTTQLAARALREAPGHALHHQALFRRVMGRIYRYFRRMVFDPTHAEDCAQETLLLLERSLREGTYDPTKSFNTWMWLKAHSVYAQWCRCRERRKEEPLADHEPAADDEPIEVVANELDKDAVLRRVRSELGDETFEAFVLYYQSGLTHAQIGELLGRHRTTISERIDAAHRVIDRLLQPGAREAEK